MVRNIGWPMASGTFVHFLDDDDIVTEGHYAAVKAAFAANPTIGLVFGGLNPLAADRPHNWITSAGTLPTRRGRPR